MDMKTVDDFVAKWGEKLEGCIKYSTKDLQTIESKTGVALPREYRHLLMTYGAIYTPNILDTVDDQEMDIADIQQFLTPDSLVETTLELREQGIISNEYIAFAYDACGNFFLLRKAQVKGEHNSIHFFDHDFGTIEKIGDSFSEFIANYLFDD